MFLSVVEPSLIVTPRAASTPAVNQSSRRKFESPSASASANLKLEVYILNLKIYTTCFLVKVCMLCFVCCLNYYARFLAGFGLMHWLCL